MTYTIKKNAAGVYLAEAQDGEVIASHATVPDSVFQTVFDLAPCEIKVEDGTYVLALASSTPLKLKSDTKISASRNAILQVPEGYSGDLFEISNAYNGGAKTRGIHVDGFNIREVGTTPLKLWNGFHFICNDGDGMTQNKFENQEFGYVFNTTNNRGPLNAYLLEVTTTDGWIRDTIFRDIVTYSTVNSFRIKKDAVGSIPSTAVSRLYWQRCTVQANSHTQYGWRGMDGVAHTFVDCFAYDFQNASSPKITSQFLSTANGILILGGIMSGDQSPTPGLYQDWQCPTNAITIIDSFVTPRIRQWNSAIYTWPSSNNGKTRTYTIPHGCKNDEGVAVAPSVYNVVGITKDALVGPIRISSVDTTNINISYVGTLPPPTTTGNPIGHIKWYYETKV